MAMASPTRPHDMDEEPDGQGMTNPGSAAIKVPGGPKTKKLSGVNLASVSRAALRGRTATLNAFNLSRSPTRAESPLSPTPSIKSETRHHSLGNVTGPFYGFSATATTRLKGFATAAGGAVGGAVGGGGGGSSTSSDAGGTGTGGGGKALPSIRKGYLLMLRDGDLGSGEGGLAGGVGGNVGAGGVTGEWSERFFFLSGHFLRYKKHSLNLTSVNLKQTDHVEFNLQSAVVEPLEEGDEPGATSLRPRRGHAFRLISSGKETAHNRGTSACSPSPPCEADVTVASGATRGDPRLSRVASWPGGFGEDVAPGDREQQQQQSRRQVWILAATSEQERAMWMQAIREAISLGAELLTPGQSGGEAGSLACLAARMRGELEVRDRHHRLRVFRSCFIGEDAVSWLQSECGPCSVEEALRLGNKMIAAGLIYHCTYGHHLQNCRLFYKFADSVIAASASSSRGGFPTRSSGGIFKPGNGNGGGGGNSSSVRGHLRDGNRSCSSMSDSGLGGRDAAGGSNSFSYADDGALGGEESDQEGSLGSDNGSLTSVSLEGRKRSVSAVGRGSGGVGSRGGSGGGGGLFRAGSGNMTVSRGGSFRESSGGRGSVLVLEGRDSAEKKVSVRRMAREMEGLKLSCAEMERSQMRLERQAQAYATGLLACLESCLDRVFMSIIATALLAAVSVWLQASRSEELARILTAAVETSVASTMTSPSSEEKEEASSVTANDPDWSLSAREGHGGHQRLTQVLLVFLVAFALYGYAKGRKAVAMAVEVTKVLCPSDPTSATSADSGMDAGDPRGGRADSTKAVPLLHPGQARQSLVDAIRMTMTTAGTPRSMRDAMARMVSNRHTAATALTGASVSTLQASQSKGNSSEEIFGGADGSTQVRDGQVLYDDGSVVRGGDSGVQMVASAGGTGGSEGGRAMEKVAQAEELMGKEGVSGSGGVDSRPELDSLPPEKEWPHHPIFVRLSPSVQGQVRLDGHEPDSSIPVNSDDIAVPFETPLFKGRLLVRVAGLPSRIPGHGDGAQDYFRGKKRLMQCAVQGSFKKDLRFDRVYTGQAYLRPFTHLPAKWLIRSAFAVIRRLSPALREDITSECPYMVSPLAATAQALRAEEPGDEAAIIGDLSEETALLRGSFMEGRVPASARKKFFSNPRNLKAYSFKPGVVYTFDFYQHLYNAVTFDLDLGFRRVKLADYLNHQPAQIMALDFETGEPLWNVEIWNAALLQMNNA